MLVDIIIFVFESIVSSIDGFVSGTADVISTALDRPANEWIACLLPYLCWSMFPLSSYAPGGKVLNVIAYTAVWFWLFGMGLAFTPILFALVPLYLCVQLFFYLGQPADA